MPSKFKNSIGFAALTLTLILSSCGTPSPTATTPGDLASAPGNVAGTNVLSAQAAASLQFKVGQTQQINISISGQPAQPGQLRWTTSKATVATVSQNGLITAIAAGNAVIRTILITNPSAYLDFSVTVDSAASTPAPVPTPTPPPASAPAPTVAQEVLQLVNSARAQARSCGSASFAAAPALSMSAQLAQAAQGHASDMAAQNYFSHTSNDGRTFEQRITATGYAFRTIGENIAAGQSTPQQVVAGWLQSEGHCRNIMNPSFRELGVGYAKGGSYSHYWVQDFGAR
ncbi:CAP domain-containing protein [Deinococcus arenicola]|uniref:CAP domain-containing protein n=1 Tax=Deinococcus arenicola TaxID=2994950 RepID=A0ABU4DUW2_9DEIO|nr:CAP domain-containing protein [Deinococcus sp. ZS9-10]MDV6376215.1 CAP domain-containing protein [Deinococcus sp. ZS9-10]